ncbi:MAG: (2Fe-2S)-binding protein [Rhizobiales bacterium]|nr:(2Fe-2S)-binding protein [Hyphomicrobiales bacterium]
MSLKVEIAFKLNGHAVAQEILTSASTLQVLNRDFDLAGAKLACGEGECGACTILVDGVSRNACLMAGVDLDGRDVETVEGLWESNGLDPVQEAFVKSGAVQCGYCTPGMVMQAKYLLKPGKKLSRDEVLRGLEGNVCRCTGYHKIVDAIVAVSGETS